MQQPLVSPTLRANTTSRKAGSEYRGIRPKGTGTTQVITNNSFLKEQFTDLCLTEIETIFDTNRVTNPEKNIEKLIKVASNYLSLYGKELLFKPCGIFGRDITDLINRVTDLLPEHQLLNVDYSDDEFFFAVYQSHPTSTWDTICYIPISIAKTMRPKIRKLFIRFIAFMMQQNYIPFIKDTTNFEIFIEDVQYQMKEEKEEVNENVIQMMRSYKNSKGEANQFIKLIEQNKDINPCSLLDELKSIKRISKDEAEQVKCMIRGIELMCTDVLTNYIYDETYDEYTQECDNERIEWHNLISVSWGMPEEDSLVEYHFQMMNDECGNMGATEPLSYLILSPEKQEKLSSCEFPYLWLEYICNDYFKHLVINE